MKTTSKITGLQYEPGHDTVYITNMVQAKLYMRNGARLLDILYDNTKMMHLFLYLVKVKPKNYMIGGTIGI